MEDCRLLLGLLTLTNEVPGKITITQIKINVVNFLGYQKPELLPPPLDYFLVCLRKKSCAGGYILKYFYLENFVF